MKKNHNFFNTKRGSWIHISKILSDRTLIVLERTMYLAIILLLVQYRVQNHWSDGRHNAKVRTVKINRQQVNINAYVRCFGIIVEQGNIWIFFVTLIHLCIDMYLVKINWENNWHVPCLAEEKEIVLRWFSSDWVSK